MGKLFKVRKMSGKTAVKKIVKSSIKASNNAAKNSARIAKQQEAQRIKQAQYEFAKNECEVSSNHIHDIQSVHKRLSPKINWTELKSIPRPFADGEVGPNESQAQQALNSYSPGFFDKVFKKTESNQKKLQDSVLQGRSQDEKLIEAWESQISLAESVINREFNGLVRALELFNPFRDLNNYGVQLSLSVENDAILRISANVSAERVVPETEKTLTATGRSVEKKISNTRYNEMYQDFICSLALRVARDILVTLPTDKVKVDIFDEKLSTSTGYLEKIAVFSGVFPSNTLTSLNFDLIDPSDALANFKHNMKFLKTKGLQEIELVSG